MLAVAEHYAITDTGRQRRANEDSLLDRCPLFAVADGMGGAQAGEVASRIAVEVLGEAGTDFSDPRQALIESAKRANARIYELSHRDAAHAGMGTTMTALYVGEREVTVAHVGDSRAYRMRDGQLERLTEDHSLVDELIRQGRLTPEEAEEHPQRSIITRALGPEASVLVDAHTFPAEAGDVYMICSDGLTGMLSEQLLAEILNEHLSMRDAAVALVQAANEAGGRDNITAVLVRLEQAQSGSMQSLEPLFTLPDGLAQGQEQPTRAHSATALAEAPPTLGSAQQPQLPRAPAPQREPAHGRRRRRSRVATIIAAVVLALLVVAAYLTMQSVFFIGTNARGEVTIFRGLPYVLPGGIRLYTTDYVSGVSAASLTPQSRRTLLNNALRSEENAGELVRALELGRLSGG